MNVTKNYLYNLSYQILILILPLITVPYVSRVLGPNGVGINSYTNSIVQYFILFGTLGINLYANRQIAYVRDDKEKRCKTFWEIFHLKNLTIFIALIFYILFVFIIDSKYKVIYLIQAINILGAAVDISWFFIGIEDFKKTVTRNFIVKIFSTVCVFIFVRNLSDTWIYVLILGLGNALGQLTMWFYMPRYVKIIKIKLKDMIKHLKPTISLFIPQIAIQIYVVMDRTMLGNFTNISQVGIYDNSQKIIQMCLAVVTSLGSVMLPRISNLFANKNYKKINEYMSKTYRFATYISIPMIFGLIGISDNFSIWFFGIKFKEAGLLMSIISPIILFIAWSNVIGMQYMLPVGKEKAFTFSVTIGAAINFILNLILIPKFYAVGTSIASVAAEFSVTLTQIILVKNELPFKKMYRGIGKNILGSTIMYLIIRFIGLKLGYGMITTFIQIFSGIIIYFIMMILLKSEINKIILNKIIKLKIRYF